MVGTPRAQSETVGVLLLTAVFVVLAGTLGVFLISTVMSSADDGPLVDVEGNATSQYVTIRNAGGDSVRAADVAVIVDGDSRSRYDLVSFDQRHGTDASRFAPGDAWRGPNDVGGDPLEVRVIDEASNTVLDRETIEVTVTMGARIAYGPNNPTRGEQITFDGGDSEIRGSSIDTYEWDFTDDGSVDATGETAQHSFASTGTYPVELEVTAADGRTVNTTREVQVYNGKPSASFTYSPSGPTPGDGVTFDASGSSDDGSIVAYQWDFGDGNTSTGEVVGHAYDASGSYAVELTVTDDEGATDTRTETVTVDTGSPTAEFTYAPADPTTQDVVAFDGTNSTGGGPPIASYEWDFGDGNTTTGPQPAHSYADDGAYDVTLTVTNDAGGTASTTETVQVDNVAPTTVVGASDATVHTQEPVTFDASGTVDSDGTVQEYRWDFDDGNTTTTTGDAAIHRFESPGRYTVELTAVDDDGATNSTSVTVEVGGLRVSSPRTHRRQGTATIVEVTLENNASTDFDVTALTIDDSLPTSNRLLEEGESFRSYSNAPEGLIEDDFGNGFFHPPDGRAEAGTWLWFPLSYYHGDTIDLDDPGTVAGSEEMGLYLMDFVDSSGNHVDMRGTQITVTVEIEYADGITDEETVTFTP